MIGVSSDSVSSDSRTSGTTTQSLHKVQQDETYNNNGGLLSFRHRHPQGTQLSTQQEPDQQSKTDQHQRYSEQQQQQRQRRRLGGGGGGVIPEGWANTPQVGCHTRLVSWGLVPCVILVMTSSTLLRLLSTTNDNHFHYNNQEENIPIMKSFPVNVQQPASMGNQSSISTTTDPKMTTTTPAKFPNIPDSVSFPSLQQPPSPNRTLSYEICFITSEFSVSAETADSIPIIQPIMRTKEPRFFLFTNRMPNQLQFQSTYHPNQNQPNDTDSTRTTERAYQSFGTVDEILQDTGWYVLRMVNENQTPMSPIATTNSTTPTRQFLPPTTGNTVTGMPIPGSPYQRLITQSRWPKFLGWQHPRILQRQCQVIFYGDAYLLNPINETMWQQFAKMTVQHSSSTLSVPFSSSSFVSKSDTSTNFIRTCSPLGNSTSSSSLSTKSVITTSSYIGLMQDMQLGANDKPVKGPLVELKVNARMGKLSWEMANRTIEWMKQQTPYQTMIQQGRQRRQQQKFSNNERTGSRRAYQLPIIPIYKNALFGYNPQDCAFQQVAMDFWNQYSKEDGSWRDQPYWSYYLAKHRIKPIPFVKGIVTSTGQDDRSITTKKTDEDEDEDTDQNSYYSLLVASPRSFLGPSGQLGHNGHIYVQQRSTNSTNPS